MRVELDETGRMIVTSESPVESFALSHWFDLWTQHKAVLQVTTLERREGQEVKNLDPPLNGHCGQS